MLGALDSEVDQSQSKLRRAMGRMDEMVRRGEERAGGWCITILIVVSTVRLGSFSHSERHQDLTFQSTARRWIVQILFILLLLAILV